MQPFLSGETTMVYLLTILTFLFFVAAGTDHPVDEIHIQEPVHIPKPVPSTATLPPRSTLPVAPLEDKKRQRARQNTITSRLRNIILSQSAGVFIYKHSIWSTWSVQGWNFPLWRRNYFGRKKTHSHSQQLQAPNLKTTKTRRHTVSGINRPAVSMAMPMMDMAVGWKRAVAVRA